MDMLALDFGASGGRAVLGRLEGGKMHMEMVSAFPNEPVEKDGHMHWNVDAFIENICESIKKAVDGGADIATIGIDTWGVDYGLVNDADELVNLPFHYRDKRTEDVIPECEKIMPQKQRYAETGIAYQPFNTLFQLCAEKKTALEGANALFMPDLISFLLCGRRVTEYTAASTGQLIDPLQRDFSKKILEKFDIPQSVFAHLTQPGEILSPLKAEIAQKTGAKNARVACVAGHDTASAVVAVPAQDGDFAYISSGTWSLMGTELDEPILTDEARLAGFTNEGGALGKVRFLKNIMGLWIIQECRRQWQKEGQDLSWDEIVALAQAAEPFAAVINVDDASFYPPGDMPARIREYCKKTGQKAPEGVGQIARIVYEGLALRYAYDLANMEKITGRRVQRMHIVGGGSKNSLLNGFAAMAMEREVVAGPTEATALGNLLMQAHALGLMKDLSQMRACVRDMRTTSVFMPRGDFEPWRGARQKLEALVEHGSL